MKLEARHVAVLLDPDEPRKNRVLMPEHLGRWIRAPTYVRERSHPWHFELSERGKTHAAAIRRVSDAANESMREYLQGEHANCFPGVFRDGFCRGAGWRETELFAEIDRLTDELAKLRGQTEAMKLGEAPAKFVSWLAEECFTCIHLDDYDLGPDATIIGHLHADGTVHEHRVVWGRFLGSEHTGLPNEEDHR